MNIVQRGDRAVKPPSLPSDSPYTPQSKERQSKERQSKVQSRVRRGYGYYKHLVGSARAIISELRLDESYKRAVLGMIARTIDGKVIHRDEFLGRLSSLRSEIEARAQRESDRISATGSSGGSSHRRESAPAARPRRTG
jgi:hypothetical protein